MAKDSSTLDGTIATIDGAIRSLGLEDDMRQVLVEPWREIQVGMPVRMDDGLFGCSEVTVHSTMRLVVPTREVSGITRTPIWNTFELSEC